MHYTLARDNEYLRLRLLWRIGGLFISVANFFIPPHPALPLGRIDLGKVYAKAASFSSRSEQPETATEGSWKHYDQISYWTL